MVEEVMAREGGGRDEVAAQVVVGAVRSLLPAWRLSGQPTPALLSRLLPPLASWSPRSRLALLSCLLQDLPQVKLLNPTS